MTLRLQRGVLGKKTCMRMRLKREARRNSMNASLDAKTSEGRFLALRLQGPSLGAYTSEASCGGEISERPLMRLILRRGVPYRQDLRQSPVSLTGWPRLTVTSPQLRRCAVTSPRPLTQAVTSCQTGAVTSRQAGAATESQALLPGKLRPGERLGRVMRP